MGLLDRLFGGSDPALAWQADANLKITLDLDKHELCGIRLGDHSDRIARLGPPENPRPSKAELYAYGRHGFFIDVTDRSVDCFTLIFDEKTYGAESAQFQGTVTYRGQPIDLSAATSENVFRQRFGKPYWRDVEDDETLLFYEFGKVEWQVEFDNGHLGVMTITTPPLLSDPEQRTSYRVDKPWPPPIG